MINDRRLCLFILSATVVAVVIVAWDSGLRAMTEARRFYAKESKMSHHLNYNDLDFSFTTSD